MIGSDRRFGNRDAYLLQHGNYNIFDYNTAIEKNLIDSDYYVWWGYEDNKLFEYAKDEILRLSKEDKPFNFSLLTANTHSVDGYLEESCENLFNSNYENTIYCSAKQIADFVSWIQEQAFYSNTSIVIVGDHLTMQPNFYSENVDRGVYNLFINSAVAGDNYKQRQFSTMDYFPTTLASLGVSIEGNRLGLGTNLFSNKKTLNEEVGLAKFDEELGKYSSFYNKELTN